MGEDAWTSNISLNMDLGNLMLQLMRTRGIAEASRLTIQFLFQFFSPIGAWPPERRAFRTVPLGGFRDVPRSGWMPFALRISRPQNSRSPRVLRSSACGRGETPAAIRCFAGAGSSRSTADR